MSNCGILALQNVSKLENISIATILRLAKDNGVTLYAYKLEKIDRPFGYTAILHSTNPDHFSYVWENTEPDQSLNYSGYVISTSKIPRGRKLKKKEMETILGGKKGGVLRQVVPVLLAFVPGVGPALSAASAIGMDQYAKSNHPEQLGKPGNPLDIITTGATAYFGAKGIAQPLTKGFTATNQGGTSLLQNIGKGFKGATNNLLTGSPFGAAPKTAFGMPTPAGYTGSVTVPGLGNNIPTVQGLATGNAGLVSTKAAAPVLDLASKNLLGGGVIGSPLSNFKITQSSGIADKLLAAGGLKNVTSDIGKTLGLAGAGALASGMMEQPKYPDYYGSNKFVGDYSTIRTYLGDQRLPAATEKQLNYWVETPLDKIGAENFDYDRDRDTATINKSFDDQITQIRRMGAQSGQSEQTSSDIRNRIDEINKNREQAIRDYGQEKAFRVKSQALEAKQWALSQKLQQNQFDERLAMELASLKGRDQELKYAIESNDYNRFQEIMGDILQIGYEHLTSKQA